MIEFKKKTLRCYSQSNPRYINRVHTIISCTINSATAKFEEYLHQAIKLASRVCPNAANESNLKRNSNRIMQDALGGVLAEQGWLDYLNSTFGNIASSTPFTSANGQIDIELKHGERIEVRSSFPYKGVKFAICNSECNFKIIGRYTNVYKPNELNKDYYSCVLFETLKTNILTDKVIDFSLIGVATAEMMIKLGYDSDLVAEGDLTEVPTKYRVLKIKNCLDINAFEALLKGKGL